MSSKLRLITVVCASYAVTLMLSHSCDVVMDECLDSSPYVIRQYESQDVMSWTEARALCFDSGDDSVDGMATFDTSSSALSSSSLDEQFALLRAECSALTNADGRKVNCWVGGKLNETQNGYIFSSEDTNRLDYSPKLLDPTRWGCVRNKDGSCIKDIEGITDNGEDYLVLFQNRDYYLADWPIDGGTNPDFQVTAVVCNNGAFSYSKECQCSCDWCDIYGDLRINTFDGVPLHSGGECAYYAVSLCEDHFDSDFPITISIENTECFYGFSTCLRAVYVSFYDKTNTLQTVIKLEHILNEAMIETVVSYVDKGALSLSGHVSLNQDQIWMDNHHFSLTKQNKAYNLRISINGEYQSATIYFRDLNDSNNKSLSQSYARIALSSCFAQKTCGVCGYYDGDKRNELMLRWEEQYIELTDIYDINQDDMIEFTMSWIDWDRSGDFPETCNEEPPVNVCQIQYCDDECLCDDAQTITTYNNTKETQCNFDLSACLGLLEYTEECDAFRNKDNTEQQAFIEETAPDCAYLAENYCCYPVFCSTTPDFCLRDAIHTDEPTIISEAPTHSPTSSPTDPPSLIPSMAPTSGPTKTPTYLPTTPTEYPTVSPITDSLCTEEGLDIVFVVDNSCGLDVSECKKRQHGISELIASIKDGADPRIGYITFSDEASVDLLISLDDLDYNDVSDVKDSKNKMKLINYIKGLDCGVLGESTELLYGINGALQELKEKSSIDRDKKIVIISHCEYSTDIDACSLMEDDALLIDDKYVEITVINIAISNDNIMTDTYLQCLTENEPERFLVIPDVDKASFEVHIASFVSAVCESDTVSPTSNPTSKPTLSPLEKACDFDYECDIIFVVDVGCGFNQEECGKQQAFLSDVLQSVKTSNQPRVGYVDCNNEESSWLIRLNNAVFNHPTELANDAMLRELYLRSIRDRLPCNGESESVFRMECINDALNEFEIYSDANIDKKLVIYSACDSKDDVCLLFDDIEDQEIEVILINIGDEKQEENICLLQDIDTDKALLYTMSDINIDEEISKSIRKKVTNAICTQPTPKPSSTPTSKPTLSPEDAAAASINVCRARDDTDVLFVIDATCGLDDATCLDKREFVASLVESIKLSHNPRVSLVECGSSFVTQSILTLSDASFNDINDESELSAEDRNDLYLNKIDTRLQCLAGSGVPKQECLNEAVNILQSESDSTRIRKIVYIEICQNTEFEREEGCTDKLEIFNENIEMIMLHIGHMMSNESNHCLYWNGPYSVYAFDDFQLKTRQDIEIKNELISHICESNAFGIGELRTTSTKSVKDCIPLHGGSPSSSIDPCGDWTSSSSSDSSSSDREAVVATAPTRTNRNNNKWPTQKPINRKSANNQDKTWNKNKGKTSSNKKEKGNQEFNWNFKASSRGKVGNKNKNKNKDKSSS